VYKFFGFPKGQKPGLIKKEVTRIRRHSVIDQNLSKNHAKINVQEMRLISVWNFSSLKNKKQSLAYQQK
jgi:hypothetical protein